MTESVIPSTIKTIWVIANNRVRISEQEGTFNFSLKGCPINLKFNIHTKVIPCTGNHTINITFGEICSRTWGVQIVIGELTSKPHLRIWVKVIEGTWQPIIYIIVCKNCKLVMIKIGYFENL
jgi:hypothetical protein